MKNCPSTRWSHLSIFFGRGGDQSLEWDKSWCLFNQVLFDGVWKYDEVLDKQDTKVSWVTQGSPAGHGCCMLWRRMTAIPAANFSIDWRRCTHTRTHSRKGNAAWFIINSKLCKITFCACAFWNTNCNLWTECNLKVNLQFSHVHKGHQRMGVLLRCYKVYKYEWCLKNILLHHKPRD